MYLFTYLFAFHNGPEKFKKSSQENLFDFMVFKIFSVICLFTYIICLLFTGGSHKYSLDPEEYIFAALNIYLDVIMLFKYLVCILAAGGGGGDD